MNILLNIIIICFFFQCEVMSREFSELGEKSFQIAKRYMSFNSKSSDFVESIKRVLTTGEVAHHSLKNEYKPAFFYRHWLTRWDTTSKDGHHKFNSYPEAEFEKHYTLLSQRLAERSTQFLSNAQVGFYPSGEILTAEKENQIDSRLTKRIENQKPFVPGQIVSLQGITTFPMNLFTLAQEGNNFINFGTPFHHGFYFRNLKDYYDSIALLREWGAYRDFRIISIPAGVRINCRIGLVGHQSFPRTDTQYFRDNMGKVHAESMDIDSLQNLQRLCSHTPLDNFVENRIGGEIQIMFGFVERYSVYDYGALCVNIDQTPKKYAKKNIEGLYKPSNQGELSHFLDLDYFQTPFQLENILFKLNTIDETERDRIREFLYHKNIRKK